jgi:hypothetical protein
MSDTIRRMKPPPSPTGAPGLPSKPPTTQPPEDLLGEINSLPSVSPGYEDIGDMMDKTEPSGRTSAAPEKKTAGWSVRL